MVATGLAGMYLLHDSSLPLRANDPDDHLVRWVPITLVALGSALGVALGLLATKTNLLVALVVWILASLFVWFVTVMMVNIDRAMPVSGGGPNPFGPGSTDLANGMLAWSGWTLGAAVAAAITYRAFELRTSSRGALTSA
jgi:hypothetical protein